MAKIKGTNGNDSLTGTVGDDFLFGYLGMDDVDGGAGYDVLTIDYSAVTSSVFPGSMELLDDGTWTGGVSSGVNGGAVNVTAFGNVERVVYTASQDIDYLNVDLGSLALDPSRLKLDGAGGDDVLRLFASDVDTGTAFKLTVAAGGTAQSNVGVLSNWETYEITLGKAIGNKVVLGAGDDSVQSTGGKDNIDLGAGDDQWEGDYRARTDALGFSYYSAAQGLVVNSAKANIAVVKNVEEAVVLLGSGNDKVDFYDGAGYVVGGGGNDTLIVHPTTTTAPLSLGLNANFYSGAIEGSVVEKTNPSSFLFNSFRTVTLGGSLGDDSFKLDLATKALANGAMQATLEGGGGTDDLTLDLRATGPANLYAAADGIGFGTLSFATDTNALAFRSIEALTVKFGAGDDHVGGALAQTQVIDGGDGSDTIDFSALGTGIAFRLGYQFAQTSGSGAPAYTVTNVENLVGTKYDDHIGDNALGNVIYAGDGNDWVTVGEFGTAATADVFYGNAGVDRIDYQLVGGPVSVSLAVTTAQNTGAAGTDTIVGFENLTGSNYGDVLTGDDGNNVLWGGYGGSGGDPDNDILEGLGGNDTLNGGNTGSDTASYAHAASAVTVSLATAGAQNTGGAGTDTLVSIENLNGSGYADTLTGSGGNNVVTGGLGSDALTGGGGADVFAYTSTLDSNSSGYDRITDFSHAAGDRIDLAAIDANTTNFVRNDTFKWIGDAAFHGVAGELREVGVRGGGFFLYGDTNGDKTADLTIFVSATTALLPNSDIVL